jgi:hypothetical protein
MRIFVPCLALFLAFPLNSSPLVAQTDPGLSNLGWVSVGLGWGRGDSEGYVALGAEASILRGAHLVSGRWLGFLAFDSGGGRTAREAAALYGRTHRGRRHQAAFSAGPSFLRCQRWSICGDPDLPGDKWTYESKIGLAMSGQIFWTPSRFFGIGLSGFANMNSNRSFYGAMLALRLGKLR